MSFRIEQADPLALLRELPDEWAQSCITSPRRDTPLPYLLDVLEQVHRVLRTDGTAWLALRRGGDTQACKLALTATRWLQPLPANAIPRQVLLLTKQPGFLFHPQRPVSVVRAQRQDRWGCAARRRAWCVPAPGAGGIPARELIEWCLLASTVACACEVCGAPCRPPAGCGGRWRSTCAHKPGRGACLVIDPFCVTGEVGLAAVGHGRHYLGIQPDPANAAAARRRLAKRLEHAR